MPTIINNPGDGSGDSSALGLILGVVLALVLVVLFVIYILPGMRGQAPDMMDSVDTINIEIPTPAPADPASI